MSARASRRRERKRAVSALVDGGFVAPEAEADALLAASREGVGSIDALVARRLEGEPLAVDHGLGDLLRDPGPGRSRACSCRVRTPKRSPGGRSSCCRRDGIAVDLCTGSGAVAAVLGSAHPRAMVVGTDIDPVAVACARRNGIRAFEGDLDGPLPPELRGRVDLLTAVVPYVPTEELPFLPRDVLRATSPVTRSTAGRGARRSSCAPPRWRLGGSVPAAPLLLELGGDQASEMTATMRDLGFTDIRVHADEDGQDRAIEGRLRPLSPAAVGKG